MNTKMIARFLGTLCFIECAFLAPPLLLAIVDGDSIERTAFLLTIGILGAFGAALFIFGKGAPRRFYAREGYLLVGLAWIILSMGGSLPFIFSNVLSPVDALFESISGFTTTGATLLTNLEELSRALLLWRSLTNWIGGMGILVFLLAVVSADKGSGHSVHMLRAESPGPSVEKIAPRLKSHAQMMYMIYIGLTLIMFAVLLFCRAPVFDAITLALSTAGTGGFTIRSTSLLSYSATIQIVAAIFMLLFGINFNVHLLVITGKLRTAFKDEELRYYLGGALLATGLVCANTINLFSSFGEAILHSGFTVSSLITSTGFTTVDFTVFPAFSRAILLTLMLIGASAGSTGGGMKISRVLILCKSLRRSLRQIISPRTVTLVHMNGKSVDESVVSGTLTYCACYAVIAIGTLLIISLDNLSFETNISAIISSLCNIGPGLDLLGPNGSFHVFSPGSKLVLSACMLIGRLEIFPYAVFLNRAAWNRAR